jgi:essential nuclear protein 1
MPKATTPGRSGRRHNPLEDDVIATGVLRTKSKGKRSKDTEDKDEDHFVDARASRNILRIGRELAEEDSAGTAVKKPTVDTFGFDSRFGEDDDTGLNDEAATYDNDEAWGDDDDVVEEIEVDPADLEMYKKFMPDDEDELLKHGWDRQPTGEEEEEEPVNLADLILEKIAMHEAAQSARDNNMGPPDEDYELPPKVVEVYTKSVAEACSFHHRT